MSRFTKQPPPPQPPPAAPSSGSTGSKGGKSQPGQRIRWSRQQAAQPAPAPKPDPRSPPRSGTTADSGETDIAATGLTIILSLQSIDRAECRLRHERVLRL